MYFDKESKTLIVFENELTPKTLLRHDIIISIIYSIFIGINYNEINNIYILLLFEYTFNSDLQININY